MFIAAATDDNLGLAPAKRHSLPEMDGRPKIGRTAPVRQGRHGFGMHKQNLPTDQWIDRFADWLDMEGFLKK